ncbi:MAG: ABC transporter ATP-binding protein [Candidatus Gastranaerophilaceae bacterium]
MIKVENLSLSFEDKKLFENISIEIPNNLFTVIIGSNGTGKTTLLKIMAGFDFFDDVVVKNDFKKIFFLPQRLKYPENITLFDYISSYFFKNRFKWFLSEDEKKQVNSVLEELELLDRKNVFVEKLSSGELQKANIGMALISGADCLMLDEPTSNMDLVNQIKILNLVKNLTKRGITIVMVLHDLNLAANFGDFFVGTNPQKKLVCLNKDAFFDEKNLENIFGINFKVIKNDEKINVQISN